MKYLAACFLMVCLSFSTCLRAQLAGVPLQNWEGIDDLIGRKTNLQDVEQQVRQWLQAAKEGNDQVAIARCLQAIMHIADAKTEDTLFWKNARWMDSVLENRRTPPLLKCITLLLKEKRILQYKTRFSARRDRNNFASYGKIVYATLSSKALDSLVQVQLDTVLSLSLQFNQLPVEQLLWFSDDPLLFLFKPVFTDLVYAEQVRLFARRVPRDLYGQRPFDPLLFNTPQAFTQWKQPPAGATAGEWNLFMAYAGWMAFNRQQRPEAAAYIETLARKFFYYNLSADTVYQQKYELYLQSLVFSPYAAVKAHGVYQLCLLWNSKGKRYNAAAGSNYNDRLYRLYSGMQRSFDTAYRQYYAKALRLFVQHAPLMDSFPFMARVLQQMQRSILAPQAVLELTEFQTPGKPIAAALQFRNVPQLYIRIVQLSPLAGLSGGNSKLLPWLLNAPVVRDTAYRLPGMNDYQQHHLFVKLDALPVGRYAVLYADTLIGPTVIDRMNFLDMKVTNLAVIQNEQRLFIVDRMSGFPVNPVTVTRENKEMKWYPGGYVLLKKTKENDTLLVVSGTDSLLVKTDKRKADLPETVYSKDEYDGMLDYYEENTQLHIFTDRAIYRPGQTMHYKCILLTRDPKTGEPLVVNWRNMKFPVYEKLFYRLMVKMKRKSMFLPVEIKDPFHKVLDTIKMFPNKFGSFAGSFTIPKQAATGEWQFDTDGVELDYNSGFKVEEYKRPNFEVVLERPRHELRLGDSFAVAVKTTSFAGAALNNVHITYEVSRSVDMPDGVSRSAIVSEGDTVIQSDGRLLLPVTDSLLQQTRFPNDREWTASYNIEITATDATGESHEETLTVQLSSRPVSFEVPLAATLERNDLGKFYIGARSAFAGQLKRNVTVSLYKVTEADAVAAEWWMSTDTALYTSRQLKEWFPGLDLEGQVTKKEQEQLVYETPFLAGGEDYCSIPQQYLSAGRYRLKVVSLEQGRITGSLEKELMVFDTQAGTFPNSMPDFHYLKYNSVEKGKPVTWITGHREEAVYAIYHLSWYQRSSKGVVLKQAWQVQPQQKGLYTFSYPVPGKLAGQLVVTQLYIRNGQFNSREERIYVPQPNTRPEIVAEQYRKKLTPGGRETFVVSIKTKAENIAAELMTTLYDRSLDQLEKHEWQLPGNRNGLYLRNNWNYTTNSRISNGLYSPLVPVLLPKDNGRPLWWMQQATYAMDGSVLLALDIDDMSNQLMGKLAGLSVTSTTGLEEVVVVGYGVQKQLSASGAVTVQIRGAGTLSGYKNMLVVLDGKLYEGALNNLDVATITNALNLKGADATSLYGSRAAGGVLLLSTKGPVQLPVVAEAPPPPVIIRRNFAETGFFFPQLHADRDGYYRFSFTLPESVTGWKWKMLAHTKKAAFAYEEKELVSQLPLMVQPAMPRFLYQGDQMALVSRITNLDSAAVKGTARCLIEDAVTGEDLSGRLLTGTQQAFTLMGNKNTSVTFMIRVPEALLHPLRVRITAATVAYSDGEEHLLPVLAKKILVTQQVPVLLDSATAIDIHLPELPADAIPYGTGLYITPKPQAALLYALPYLANYPYQCAEQTFNKLLAHTIACVIARNDSSLQRKAVPGPVKESGRLPDELDENVMPWLQLNHANAIHQQQLNQLLDTLYSREKISQYLAFLKNLQQPDGGMAWFTGGRSSFYISCYILEGFGKLRAYDAPMPAWLPALVRYCDTVFLDSNTHLYSTLPYAQARSYWHRQYPLSQKAAYKLDSLWQECWQQPEWYSIGRQAVFITVTLRMNMERYRTKAVQLLESIRQRAISDPYGIRWKEIADADDLDTRTEEWVVKIATAFETAGTEPATVRGIVQWLLRAKQQHQWSTTKATAEAVSLLQRQQPAVTGTALQLQTIGGSNTLQVTDDLRGGQLAAFDSCSNRAFPAVITVQKKGTGPVSGGLQYYYFTAQPKADTVAGGVAISRSLLRYNSRTDDWELLAPGTPLAIADKIRTRLTITTRKQLSYVLIEDKRAAILEPGALPSEQVYTDGFYYYRSVRDAGTQFFAEKIPAGISRIEYETTVNGRGEFTYGTASLQCMYQPEVKAYSGSSHLIVK